MFDYSFYFIDFYQRIFNINFAKVFESCQMWYIMVKMHSLFINFSKKYNLKIQRYSLDHQ